jgi:apolipoprotein D and lipocalin family protein
MKIILSARLKIGLLLFFCFAITGCLGVPPGAEAVKGFELDRYLGTWYEIARLDHSFERGLSRVTAEYSLKEDGGVRVLNRGYEAAKGEWSEAEGKAYLIGDTSVGQLKVSFFGPFYGAYNVIELDKESYQWSLVVGPDTDYLWILSRTPTMDKAVVDQLLASAKALGFNTREVIFVDQDAP